MPPLKPPHKFRDGVLGPRHRTLFLQFIIHGYNFGHHQVRVERFVMGAYISCSCV